MVRSSFGPLFLSFLLSFVPSGSQSYSLSVFLSDFLSVFLPVCLAGCVVGCTSACSFLLSFVSFSSFLGSGPERGRSLVEWEDFLSVRPFVCPPLWAIQPGLRREQMDGKSPHSTGLRPLLGLPLCFPPREPRKVEQGKGAADHWIPLSD